MRQENGIVDTAQPSVGDSESPSSTIYFERVDQSCVSALGNADPNVNLDKWYCLRGAMRSRPKNLLPIIWWLSWHVWAGSHSKRHGLCEILPHLIAAGAQQQDTSGVMQTPSCNSSGEEYGSCVDLYYKPSLLPQTQTCSFPRGPLPSLPLLVQPHSFYNHLHCVIYLHWIKASYSRLCSVQCPYAYSMLLAIPTFTTKLGFGLRHRFTVIIKPCNRKRACVHLLY